MQFPIRSTICGYSSLHLHNLRCKPPDAHQVGRNGDSPSDQDGTKGTSQSGTFGGSARWTFEAF
eukprot:1156517-Pelagomonas_calceolata.AAC.5